MKLFLLLLLLLGCFPDTSAASDGTQVSIVFPLLSPRISSKYGTRKHPIYKTHKHHNGLDLAAPMNSHVRAVAKGRVVFAGTYARYGKLVTIEHSGGFQSLYGHLNEILVNVGETVKGGDLIGRVGQTGGATGPHLHFEWRLNGVPRDPLKVFPSFLAPAEG